MCDSQIICIQLPSGLHKMGAYLCHTGKFSLKRYCARVFCVYIFVCHLNTRYGSQLSAYQAKTPCLIICSGWPLSHR